MSLFEFLSFYLDAACITRPLPRGGSFAEALTAMRAALAAMGAAS